MPDTSPFRSYLDRTAVTLDFDPETSPSLTKQAFREQCDINNIIDNWNATGIVPDPNLQPPMFGDFSSSIDFQAAENAVIAAQASFDQLPSKIRNRMGNDPAQFMAFLEDESNDEEAIALGLKTDPEAVQAQPVPAPPPAEPPPESSPEPPAAPVEGGG